MALVTVQRSPSPSTDHDTDSLSEDTTDGKSHAKKRLKTTKQKLRKVLSSVRFVTKLRPGLSESYFAYKGAALILPHTERTRKSSKKSHGGEIQDHLQAMLLLLRPEDQIKIAVRLEAVQDSVYKRYICVVATRGRQDTEEAVILGMDCRHGEAVIGLVLPMWLGVKIQLEGDGSFRLCTDEQAYLFNPVSVQAMWSAIQSLVKVVNKAEEMKYIHDGLTHTWVEYYRSRIDHSHVARNHYWNCEGVQIFAPSIFNVDDESIKLTISNTMKKVMLSVDLEEVSCRDLRNAVEDKLGFSIKKYKAFFDEELIRIFGQLEGPAKILDYLYLGSEWNASNLDELKANGIGYILNVTKEIDNFFAGTFHYYTVRLIDVPESDLLKHWDKTFKFISKARSHGSKVFVHCKMGISRSASTVMAYLMKENRWSVDDAFKFVKDRRSVANPNEGFMEQLRMYEAILSASNKREYFATKAQDTPPSPQDEESMSGEGVMDQDYDYDCVLGDSMMNVMASEWLDIMPSSASPEHDLELLQYGSRLLPLGPDLEGAESRSGDSLEESLSDMPSSPLSCAKNTGKDGTPDPAGSINPSGSPGLFKVKPDSFWIKQEEDTTMSSQGDCVEMREDSTGADCGDNDNQRSTAAILEDQQNLKSTTTAICNLETKLNPPDLSSENDSENQNVSSSPLCPSNPHNGNTTSFPTTGASSVFPDSLSQISAHGTHSSPNISLHSLSTEQHVEKRIEDTLVTTKPTLPLPHADSQQDRLLLSALPKHDCETTTSNIQHQQQQQQHSNPNASSTPGSDVVFNSMQQKDNPELAAEATTQSSIPPSVPPGKVESGVRDYFFREKIPWNPGKVQKIREGIDRVGFIAGDLANEEGEEEDNGMERTEDLASSTNRAGSPPSPWVSNQNSKIAAEDEDRFKMDIDKEKIILDECMEVSSPKRECDAGTIKTNETDAPSTTEVGGALSLYEKEEIPLEPGVVLRTRMEIEERNKFSAGDGDLQQTPSSPTKPVMRTSSLKMANEDIQPASNLSPRRVSCGPVMDRIKNLRNVESDNPSSGDVMMEEDVNEIEFVGAALEEEGDQAMLVEKGTMEIRNPDLCVDFGPNLLLESSTDPEKAEDNSGIVKSFVRKLEKLPSNEQKTTSGTETVAMSDAGNEEQATNPPLDLLVLNSSNSSGSRIDLGFISGESNTDNEVLINEARQDQPHITSKSDVTTAVVRHLVGQFETKTPQECAAAAESPRPIDLQCGDNAENTTNEILSLDSISNVIQGSAADPQPSLSSSGQKHTASSMPSPVSLFEKDMSNTADVLPLSISHTKSTSGDAYSCREERQKEGWNPYQQISPQSTVEDISSLRQKFEKNGSCEEEVEARNHNQSAEKNRKLPRPKSVERMCGLFEGKSKSDTTLTEEKKEDAETTLRQVSEEGRKVRRLHGKSHPLTKLSQGRGVFHSSM